VVLVSKPKLSLRRWTGPVACPDEGGPSQIGLVIMQKEYLQWLHASDY